MPKRTPKNMTLVLSEQEGLGRIRVNLESFFDFSFELAEGLEDLVALWRDRAAPAAQRCAGPSAGSDKPRRKGAK